MLNMAPAGYCYEGPLLLREGERGRQLETVIARHGLQSVENLHLLKDLQRNLVCHHFLGI